MKIFSKWFYKKIYYKIRDYFNPPQKYILDVIPKDWLDKDVLIERILPIILIDFIEREKALEMIDFGDKRVELEKYYGIAKFIPELDERIEKAYEEASKGDFDYEFRYKKLDELEEKREKLLTELMTWMIVNRHILWT